LEPERSWDVIVAGAGPGGSTLAGLLAEAGVRVLVLEREEFPRFHVGESLLPATELLTTLLDIEPDPEVFLFKRGAQFVCEATDRSQTFGFDEALPGPQRYAWHVERARFDTLIRDRAVENGAVVRHGVSVEQVAIEPDAAVVSTTKGRERGRYFVDATGLDRLLARQHDSIEPYEQFGRAAVFTRFSGTTDAAREVFLPNNDIRIIIIEDGWLWAIPLTHGRLSVGLVTRKPGLRRSALDHHLRESRLLSRLTDGAERHETGVASNFSFRNTRASGPRFCCVGDAACFIDPVFSSGISLAMKRAALVAERLVPALDAATEAAPDLMVPVEQSMQRGYDTFVGLVDRFYNTRFVDNMLFNAPEQGPFRAGVTSVLAGDVYRDDNDFQNMLLRSRRLQRTTSPLESADHV
jgi:flavin-dependent dehydrogenase